jgi:hypothetical protein
MVRIRGCAALLLGLVCVFASAQTNRGSISGTVKDQSGGMIAGASITVVNAGTNETRHLKSTAQGEFTVTDLEPVMYNITVEAQGFKKELIRSVKVDTASVASIVATLQPGSISTEITVTAEAATVNTESGTTSATITQREIRDAPLVNRSVLDLALTLPNVSGDAGTENPSIVSVTTCPGCNLSVNGGRPLSTLMMVDGVNNTGISLARTMVSFSPEVTQEFTVLSSAYSSEYGDTGGGVIMVTTKSGTNDFRGLAEWYNRNPAFSAAPFTQASANRPVATLKYNQFHGSVGGPVWIPKIYNGKNKTFFFVAFEPNYRRDRLDQYGLLPTAGMRSGDFSGLVNTASGWLPQGVATQFASIAPSAVTANTSVIYQNYNLVNGNQFTLIPVPASGSTYQPFPNNVIPTAMMDATALKSMQYIAPAGAYYLNSNGLISNAYLPRQLAQDEKRLTFRVDHIISERDRIYGRYTGSPIIKIQGTPLSQTTNGAEYSYAKQVMTAWTHTLSPTQFNDLRLDYTRGRFSNTVDPTWDPTTGANLNTELGLPTITKGGLPIFGGLFPGSSLGGGSSTATGLGSGGSTSVEDHEERYGVTDIYYWTHGKMNWKFGAEGSRSLQNVIPLFAAYGGSYAFAANQTSASGSSTTSGAAFASFDLGVPSTSPTLRNVEIPYYYRWMNYAGFVQNDWRVRSNLTFNLGLRYDLEGPRTEKYNNQGYFDLTQTQSMALPTPLTLQDGEVIKSALVPAFVFAGRNGVSPNLTPSNKTEFEPRFGFAWNPDFLKSHNLVVRGGYTISHVPLSGLTRLPAPDFGATNTFAVGGLNATTGAIVQSATANPNNIMRLGENPPLLSPVSVAAAVNAPANGVVTTNSLYYQQGAGAYAISQDFHSPYVQNWNLTLSWQTTKNTTIELSYVGNKGTHLFMPHEDINPKDIPLVQAQIAQGVSTTTTIADPLGRKNPATGALLQVQNGSLGSPYLGFSSLYVLYDASANSIRHGGYVNVIHRSGNLTFTANYTYAKSIDDASSAGGDKNVLTPVGGQTDGQIAFGGTRNNDRSVSTFDQRHVINGTAYYQVPFGRGQKYAANLWKPADILLGGWAVSGIARMFSGFPMMPTIADTNQLGDLTHTARPDIVPGVPLINPLWDRSCPAGNNCQPYLNPAAFERPALGALGTAPRTLDSVRGPWDQTFDVSIQKDFKIGEKGRKVQFRVDLLNALNHPIFRVFPNNAGGTDLFNAAPTATDPTTAEYNAWATLNGQPAATSAGTSGSAGDLLYQSINANINKNRVGGVAAGALPVNFFTVPLPSNFFGTNMNTFDIRTIDGYKLFRLRQQWNTSGGDLYQVGVARYIQFGIKFFF